MEMLLGTGHGEKTALIRVRAGISYALAEAMDEGHCGLPVEELVALTEKLLEVTAELVETALNLELEGGDSLLKILIAKAVSIALCAPTGRAAKRLSESTGLEAKTIHRLLETDPRTGTFRRNEEEPLDCDRELPLHRLGSVFACKVADTSSLQDGSTPPYPPIDELRHEACRR